MRLPRRKHKQPIPETADIEWFSDRDSVPHTMTPGEARALAANSLLYHLGWESKEICAMQPTEDGRWVVEVGERRWTRDTEFAALLAAWEAIQPRDHWAPPTDDDSDPVRRHES